MMRMHWRRWSRGLMLVCLVLLSGCQTIDNAKLFLPPTWVGLDALDGDLRVDHAATQAQREQVLRIRDEARTLLVGAVGEVQAHPIHVLCVTPACYQRLGGGAPHAKSFGDRRTLIGPEAVSSAYLAHEWWHTELYHRIGFSVWRQVPRWFDEGVAVWVSREPRYGEAMYRRVLAQGIAPPSLKELQTFEGFNAAVRRHGDEQWAGKPSDAVTVVYPTAAHEVHRWLDIVGIAGLRAMVDGLSRGQDFESLYEPLERQAQQAKQSPRAAAGSI